LILRTSSPFCIPDSERNVILLAPDNQNLEDWFQHAENFLATNKSWRSVKIADHKWESKASLDECLHYSNWLDSLENNSLAKSKLLGNARRYLGLYYCLEGHSFHELGAPNWLIMKDDYRCNYLRKWNLGNSLSPNIGSNNGLAGSDNHPNSDNSETINTTGDLTALRFCDDESRRFDDFFIRLGGLTKRLPRDGVHLYKFLAKNDTVCLNLTSWRDSVRGEFYP